MYPIGNESWMIKKEKEMEAYVNKYKYMVVFPDRKVELFKSLRDIENSTSLNHTTISKKLTNGEYIFNIKNSGYIYYIKPLV